MTSTSDQSPRYRVEHHQGDTVRTIGLLSEVAPHFVTLDPFVSQLLLRGATGHLLLVDDVSGAILVRREIRPFGAAKPRDRFRTRRDRLRHVRD